MPDKPELSPEMISFRRNQALDEIGRVAALAGSYARSLEEAAFRGDEATLEAHLRQLRLCCVAMIKTYKDYLEGGRGD
jgi:hypothetical protein